jgi:hypothetical protein
MLAVLVVFVISIFRNQGRDLQATLLIGTIALSLVYNQVDDGSTASVALVPLLLFVLAPFLIRVIKAPRAPATGESEDHRRGE